MVVRILAVLQLLFALNLVAAPIIESKTAKSGDIDISYRVFGTGTPLIVLNGGPGYSSEHFTPLAEKLASFGRQVILFDQRGTGRSQLKKADKTTVTLDLMVDDLEALRKHLGIEQIDILGHSFGGMYAMAYAHKYPSHVKKMILSASGGIDMEWAEFGQANILARLSMSERAQMAKLSKDKSPAAREKRNKIQLNAYVFNRAHVPKLVEALGVPGRFFQQINQLVFEDLMGKKFDLKGAFKDFKSPTLIIDGRQDFMGESVSLKIHANIPGSRLEFINECSHYPWLDQPEKYFDLINKFLG